MLPVFGIIAAVLFVVMLIMVKKPRAGETQNETTTPLSGNTSKIEPEPDGEGKWYPAKVAGVTFDNDDGSSRQKIIARCTVGEKIRLIREPDNPYDEFAIKVCRSNGEQIGYVASEYLENVSRGIDDETLPRARLKYVDTRDGTYYCGIEVNYK